MADDDHLCQHRAEDTGGVLRPYVCVEREEGLLIAAENQGDRNVRALKGNCCSRGHALQIRYESIANGGNSPGDACGAARIGNESDEGEPTATHNRNAGCT